MTWKEERTVLISCAVGALIGFLTMQARKEVQSAGGMRHAIMRRAPGLVTTEWFQPPEQPRESDPELLEPPPLEPPDPYAVPKDPPREVEP